jgi:polyhydroxybutyrate depolymerase
MSPNRGRTSWALRRAALAVTVALVVASCGGTADDAARTTVTTAPVVTEGARPSAGCESASTATTGAPSAGPVEQKVTVDGVERSYLLSTQGAEPGVPASVVVLLHGMGSSAADINRVSDLPDRAADTGTIVVTPQAVGTPTLWRAAAQGPDPTFLDQILDDLGQTQCLDTARVYIAGFSVGAVLAAAYACAHQDEIAGIVTVAVEAPAGCTQPMPILSFHGTADPVIAYGNNDPNAPGGVTGTEKNMAAWATTARCGATPNVTEVGTEVTRLEWPHCADGADVVLYRITGGGHDWPGKDPNTAVAPSTQRVSATDQALAFFQRNHS